MWDRRVRIEEVHDGDSLTVYVDDGKSYFSREKIRLFGTFAPELNQPGGPETRDFAREWVKTHSTVADWPFYLLYIRNKSNTAEEETFGRYVAMIMTIDQTECLNTVVSAFVKARGYGGGIGSSR